MTQDAGQKVAPSAPDAPEAAQSDTAQPRSRTQAALEAMAARRPSKEAMLEALKLSAGIVSVAAQKLGRSRTWLSNEIKNDPDLQAQRDETREEVTDIAEGKLFENIQKGRSEDIRFYLRCFGRARGYVEVTHLAGADGGALQVQAIAPEDNMLATWNLSLLDEDDMADLTALLPLAKSLSLSPDQYRRLAELKAKANPTTIEGEAVTVAALEAQLAAAEDENQQEAA